MPAPERDLDWRSRSQPSHRVSARPQPGLGRHSAAGGSAPSRKARAIALFVVADPNGEPTISRSERAAATIAGLGLFASLFFLVHPWYEENRDAAIYLITAQSIAAGEGYSYLGIPYLARPPGFSILLAAPLQVFGLDFQWLNGFVSLFGAAGVVLLYFHQRSRLGTTLALLVSTSIWLLPAYQKLCHRAMSDVPGLALLLGCLLVERWAARSPSSRRELWLGIAIGLSALVRSMNILLVLGIVAARGFSWLRGDMAGVSAMGFMRRYVSLIALGAMLAVTPWALRNQLVAPPSPADQVTVYDYSTGMWHQDRGDPDSPRVSAGDVIGRVPSRAVQLLHVLGSAMEVNASGNRPPDHAVSTRHALAAGGLLLGLLYGLVRRREPAEFFAAGALVVIAFYFSFQNRLVLPIYVISFAASVEMVRDLLQRLMPQRGAIAGLSGALMGLLVWNFDPHANWELIQQRHLAFASDIAAIEEHVSADACLASSAGFHYTLHLGRPVFTLQVAIRRAGDLNAIESVVDKYGIDTLMVFGDKKMEKQILAYARHHYPPGERVGSGYVFRVRARDTPCGAPRAPRPS